VGSEPIIRLAGITKTYKTGEVEVHALIDINLTVSAAEMVAIMGASGSGKSTLLNMIGLLDRPTSGSYLLEGAEVAHLNAKSLAKVRGQKIGFIFQTFNLIPVLDVEENVEFPLPGTSTRLRFAAPRPNVVRKCVMSAV